MDLQEVRERGCDDGGRKEERKFSEGKKCWLDLYTSLPGAPPSHVDLSNRPYSGSDVYKGSPNWVTISAIR